MELSDCRTCVEGINLLLLDPKRGTDSSDTLGFMVHDSIFEQFCANLMRHQITIDQHLIWDYTLYVDKDFFMMKLIHLTPADTCQREYLTTIVEHAKVSFYWGAAVTLFTTTEHYHVLMNFIADKNLKKSITRTYIKQSISYDRAELKVVEFDETVSNEIIQEFYDHHKSLPDSMYYVTYALNYLTPNNLKRFDKPYSNPNTLLILYLVLDYHRSRKIKKIREVFNILDLCAMKMAFDDPRYEYENCEFDKLIKSLLKSKKYIKSGTFNMKLYVINKGVYKLPPATTISYFVTNYQTHFNRIDYFETFKGWGKQQNFIKLAEIVDPLNLIAFLEHNEMAEIFYIDGTNFTQWSGALFIKLCEQGARRIIIDSTSVSWEDCREVEQSLEFLRSDYVKSLEIIGTNDANFIENFFNWMKLNLGEATKYFSVTFRGCQINYPFILNRLVLCKIVLHNLTITKRLLDNLARCHYEDIVTICCKLENNVAVIGGLNRIERVHMVITLEEEGHTLELFMRYVEEYMMAENLQEFEFQNKIFLITNAFLNFEEYKFVMDQNRTRLDFYHKGTGKVVDIYEYRFRNNIGADEVFDFYD